MRGRWVELGLVTWTALAAGCAVLSPPNARHPAELGPAELATSAAVGTSPLLAGAAWVDVTPTQPAYMAGFRIAKRHTEVHDPVTARALVLERGGLRVALVGVDVIGLHRYQVERIRRRLAGLIPPAGLLVAASHNHAGPDTLGLWGVPPLWTGLEEPVVERVLAGVVEAVERALLQLRPVRVRWGEVEAPAEGISRNRRDPNRIDRRLRALAFDGLDGAPVATLVHFACHPETLGSANRLLSADFPGALRDRVEAARPGSVTVFLNGALGGMVTVDRQEASLAEMTRIGAALGDLALVALAQARSLGPEGGLELRVARREVWVPVQPRFFQLALACGLFGPRVTEEGYTPSEVWGLRLGRALLLSAFGEATPALGAELVADSASEPTLLIGLGNDELGYLLHDEAWGDPRYDYERGVSAGRLASETLRAGVAAIRSDLAAPGRVRGAAEGGPESNAGRVPRPAVDPRGP